MKPIRAVTLDVGGTLIEPWPSVGHVYLEAARPYGCPIIDPLVLSAEFGKAWNQREGFDYSRAAWRRLVDQTFATASDFAVSDDCFDAIYEGFSRAAAWRVYDDVWPFIEWAGKRELPLAVVSNWDDRLRRLLEDVALSTAFPVIVVSHDVGHSKPAPEIFLTASSQLNVPPEEILHVGDSRREDFDGAQSAGLQARWLCRRRQAPVESGVIRSLAELCAIADKPR